MSQKNEKEPIIKDAEETICSTSKDNDDHNSSDSETQMINLSLRRKSRHRLFTQSFSFNALPMRFVCAGETENIRANPSLTREVTLNAPQVIDDGSDIDMDAELHISNDSSSDGTTTKSIVFPGRSLAKSDLHVTRTIRRRKSRRKFIRYKTM